MYKLTEVQEYLKNILSAQRVEQCYKLISNPKERVNTEDNKQKIWKLISIKEEIPLMFPSLNNMS